MGRTWALFRSVASARMRAGLARIGQVEAIQGDGFVVRSEVAFETLGDPAARRDWLERVVGRLALLHDDPRGLFVFDELELVAPSGHDYDAIVELAGRGIWLDHLGEGDPDLDVSTTTTLARHATDDLAAAAVPIEGKRDPVAILTAAVDNVLQHMYAADAPPPAPDDADLVLVVRRVTPLAIAVGVPDSGVHELRSLDDGTTMIRTTWNVAYVDDVAVALAEYHFDWIAEHDDPRGVPSFAAGDLEQLAAATSYEHVLAVVDARVTFVRPRTLLEIGVRPLALARLLHGL